MLNTSVGGLAQLRFLGEGPAYPKFGRASATTLMTSRPRASRRGCPPDGQHPQVRNENGPPLPGPLPHARWALNGQERLPHQAGRRGLGGRESPGPAQRRLRARDRAACTHGNAHRAVPDRASHSGPDHRRLQRVRTRGRLPGRQYQPVRGGLTMPRCSDCGAAVARPTGGAWLCRRCAPGDDFWGAATR